jgi:hypothetical protein
VRGVPTQVVVVAFFTVGIYPFVLAIVRQSCIYLPAKLVVTIGNVSIVLFLVIVEVEFSYVNIVRSIELRLSVSRKVVFTA